MIGRSLESGANGSSLLRFPDRAAYIAQWARDMSSGRAWDKWYYGDFESLRSLPTGAAIVEGISRDAQYLEKVLLLLAASNCLESVLRALHNADAERLWRRCLPIALPEAAHEQAWVSRLLALWNGTALSQGDEPARDALRLFAAARHEWPGSDGAGLCTAIDGLLLLRRVLAAFAALQQAREFLAAAISGALERARQLGRHAGCEAVNTAIEFAARNSQSNVAWSEMAADVLKPAQAEDRAVRDAFLTESGGIFLLGPAFADLNIHYTLRQAAENCERPVAAAAVLRHLLAVCCLGAVRAASSITDPAVRLFSGIDSRVSLAEMAEVLHAANVKAALRYLEERAEVGLAPLPVALDHSDYFNLAAVFPEFELAFEPEQAWSRIAHAILRHFASRQPGFAGSSPGYLWQNFLAGTGAIHVAPERVEVRLPEVPLSLVLRISGAYCSYELPWWEGVEICLRPPSE